MKKALGFVPALIMAAAFVIPGTPGLAQPGRDTAAVVIFGDDTCPGGMICVRAPESERYRIPEGLRGDRGAALAERWGDRAKSIEYAGASGVSSCSPVGSGGASGCFSQMMRARDEDNRQQREAAADGPAPQ